jgi:hypothetical protein
MENDCRYWAAMQPMQESLQARWIIKMAQGNCIHISVRLLFFFFLDNGGIK